MMSLGSFGGGGPSSSPSSSSLSALAPPFTVDRSPLTPSTTSLLQFSESPYDSSFGHPWQYANSAASGPDVYPKFELGADSTNITRMTSADDYNFGYSVSQSNNTQSNHWSTLNTSAKTYTDAFLYDPKVEAYYPPYVSPVVEEGAPLVALGDPSYDVLPSSGFVSSNASAQVDHTQNLSGLDFSRLEHPSNWGGAPYGLVDAKRGKQAELDGGLFREKSSASDSVAYTNYLNQGFNMVGCETMPEEDSASSCRKFSDVIGRESRKHLVRMEHADNTSFFAQKVPSLPFGSFTTPITSSSFTISESLPPGPSLKSPRSLLNHQNPYNPHGKGNRPIYSSFSTSVSVTKSSPTLVIRPPPVGTGLASQKSTSGQTVDIVDVAPVHQNEGLGSKSPMGMEPQVLQNSEVVEGSFLTSKLKNHKDESNTVFSLSSSAVEGPPSKVQNKDMSSPVLRMNSGSHFLIDILDGSSLPADSDLATKSSQNFADCLDHHNPAIDSPCWKGAPYFHFVPFDAVETDSSRHFVKKLDECHHMDIQVNPQFPPLHEPIRSPSEKAGKVELHHEYGSTATEQVSADVAKGMPILTSSEGVQFCEESSKNREQYNMLNDSKSDSQLKFSDSKQLGVELYNFTTKKADLQAAVVDNVMNVNDTAEGGAVAVHSTENVLCSPSSEESTSEKVKPHTSEAPPRMDVQTLIKAMQNLSDLLVFSCSSNACAPKEEDHEALKHVMANLDSLLSHRMVNVTQNKEPILPQLNNTEEVAQYLHPRKAQLDCKQYHEEKEVSIQHLPSVMNDLDVLCDDNVSQAIRKVLNKNSSFGEEEHSQAFLFKSLWLEAEAKLYSISYRARFDRMKIEMEKLKSKQVKNVPESVAAPHNCSRSENLHAPNTSNFAPPDVENVSTPKTAIQGSSSNADDIETSVMERLRVLSCRDDPNPFNSIPQQPADDVDASVMTRFHILKHRDYTNTNIPDGQQADTVQAVYSVKLHCVGDQSVDLRYEPVNDFILSVTDDSVKRSPGNSGNKSQHSIGSTDNSSSDWEHVLNEDISWR